MLWPPLEELPRPAQTNFFQQPFRMPLPRCCRHQPRLRLRWRLRPRPRLRLRLRLRPRLRLIISLGSSIGTMTIFGSRFVRFGKRMRIPSALDSSPRANDAGYCFPVRH